MIKRLQKMDKQEISYILCSLTDLENRHIRNVPFDSIIELEIAIDKLSSDKKLFILIWDVIKKEYIIYGIATRGELKLVRQDKNE